MEKTYTIKAESITKRFAKSIIFRDINLSIKTGESIYIVGPNGSGKTTLLKILAGIIPPSRGSVEYGLNQDKISIKDINNFVGYCSPLMNPYEELTGLENIHFILKKKFYESEIDTLLEKFNLFDHKDQKLKFYSSGIKQRLKLLLAVINDPPLLLFDEPGTNMDTKGKDFIYSFIESVRRDKLILLATNNMEEKNLCMDGINLG